MDMRFDPNFIRFKISFYEEILRIVVTNKFPFQLKGGFLNCLSYPKPQARLALTDDIDFVYLLPVDDPLGEENNFRKVFTPYIQKIQQSLSLQNWLYDDTETELFSDIDAYLVDYKMEEDFVSLGFNIANFTKNDLWTDFDIGLTMNLPLYFKPEPILYYPIIGDPFIVPYTASTEVQIGWKLHQCLVRVRAKDLVDLCYMIQHVDLSNDENLYQILKTVTSECMLGKAENLIHDLKKLLSGNYEGLLNQMQKENYLKICFKQEAIRFNSFIKNRTGDIVMDLVLHLQSSIRNHFDYNKCIGIINYIEKEDKGVPVIPL